MKRTILLSLITMLTIDAFGQTNTFPSSGNVGIGTTSPAYPLDVNGSIHSTGQFISSQQEPLFLEGSGSGNYTATGVYNTTSYFRIDLARISDTHYTDPIDFVVSGRGGDIFIQRTGSTSDYVFNDNNGNTLLKINGTGNVGIGTTTPQSKLAVNGTITAREVQVTATGWPDFVFDSTYYLSSLPKIADFIKAKHHLPGIPSAKEIENNGLNLGTMQKKQMQEIEELTLYQINADKKIQALEKELSELENQVKQLTACRNMGVNSLKVKVIKLKGTSSSYDDDNNSGSNSAALSCQTK